MATTLTIAGVLSAIAIPVVGNVYMNMRIKTVASEFVADLRYARAEAISRRAVVQIVAFQEKGWSKGWIVKDPQRVLIDRTGMGHIDALDPSEGKLAYTHMGTLSGVRTYSVLFHAPTFRWVQPRCVYVHPDGRPRVEANPVHPACGRK